MKEPARWEQRPRLGSSLPETPAVSLIMGVYNQKQYVALAIESILAQTFADFELIIVDDGSTDDTVGIIEGFQDPRIVLNCQPRRGLVATLNRAITLSRASLLARMDGDDVAHPTRLERQYNFLNEHPEIFILGTNYLAIDLEDNTIEQRLTLETDLLIKLALFVFNPLCHSSFMLRREVIEQIGAYRPEANHIEDYDLWLRAMPHFNFYNLQEPLLSYRVNPAGITQSNAGYLVKRTPYLAGRALQSAYESSSLLQDLRKKGEVLKRDLPHGQWSHLQTSKISLKIGFQLAKIGKLRQAYQWFQLGAALYPLAKARLLASGFGWIGRQLGLK